MSMGNNVYTLGEVDGFLEMEGIELRRDVYYIVCPYGIGDTLYVASLIESFKRYRSMTQKVWLVVKKGHGQMPDWFDAVDEKLISDELVKVLNIFCVLTGTWELNNFLYGHFRKNDKWVLLPEFAECEEKSLLYRYRKLVFHLPEDCLPEEPKIFPQGELLDSLIKKYRIGGQSVILMPYAYSIERLSADFWEEIARLLHDTGHEVFTNVKDDSEPPIRGTTGLCADIATMAALCEKCGLVIALRSGICDVLYYTEAKLVVINGKDLVMQQEADNRAGKRHIYSFNSGTIL